METMQNFGVGSVKSMIDGIKGISSVIMNTYTFAVNSPLKTKESLLTYVDYFQSKTKTSTYFIAYFFITLLDLVKNKHFETFILSIVSILESLIQILSIDDIKILITTLINITVSKPFKILLKNIMICLKSFFGVLRTKEVNQLQNKIISIVKKDYNNYTETKDINNNHDNNDSNQSNTVIDSSNDDIISMNDDRSETDVVIQQKSGWFDWFGFENEGSMTDNDIDVDNDVINDELKESENIVDVVKPDNTCTGSNILEEWVKAVQFIDSLENRGDLAINDASKLRELAIKQNNSLMILFKCYSQSKNYFIKHASILLDNI